MKSSALPYRRIVIKLGSNLLTSGRQCLDVEMMASLVLQIAALHKQGLQIIMVTSGAIAAGRYKLGKPDGIKGIPYKQVLAAVGQAAYALCIVGGSRRDGLFRAHPNSAKARHGAQSEVPVNAGRGILPHLC